VSWTAGTCPPPRRQKYARSPTSCSTNR